MYPFNVKEALENGFFISGTSGCGKTQLAKKLVATLKHHKVSTIVIDLSRSWSRADSPIQNVYKLQSPLHDIKEIIEFNHIVFDISELRIEERFRFTNSLCRAIMTQRKLSPDPKKLPWLFVVFEEAQLYLPNGCMRSLKKYGDVLELISNGRNYNVRFGLITQFPANVDKAPVKMAQQRYFGLTTEENDKKYLRSFVGKKVVEEEISRLNTFEFVYNYKGKNEKFTYEQPKNDNNANLTWNLPAQAVAYAT